MTEMSEQDRAKWKNQRLGPRAKECGRACKHAGYLEDLGCTPSGLGFKLKWPGMSSRKRCVYSLARVAGLQREVRVEGFPQRIRLQLQSHNP